jgi:beta-lactamase superfamily II metal-dependent hydrolase
MLGLDSAAPANTAVEGELEVHFIDVGNADCTLVRQGDHTLLVDAGERGDGDDILEYLREQGVTKLDLVVATHAHADHIGSMADVLQALPVGRFLLAYMPEEETPTTATYLNMLEALDNKQIPTDEAKPNAVYEIGDARLQVLAPLQESKDTNDMSVVTRLTFGNHVFLFTGDAGTDVEKDMLQAGHTLQADVLKVGHHGSDTSSSEAFLKRVAPNYAMIPCGEGNSYGHPHKEILQRLNALGATIYRSDLHGDVVFTTDGSNLSVHTED